MIDIKGLDKGEVLAALYNASRQQGMGFLHARGGTNMTPQEARAALVGRSYFDYLHGRVLKVDLSGDELEERLYDRDNGYGAAARAIDRIRRAPVRVTTEQARATEDDETVLPFAADYSPSPISEPERYITPAVTAGGGGDFGGGGASGDWDASSSSSSSSSSDSSSSSSSSDSGSSSSGSD